MADSSSDADDDGNIDDNLRRKKKSAAAIKHWNASDIRVTPPRPKGSLSFQKIETI